MEYLDILLHTLLHIDQHIANWIVFFGPWLYVIIFLIVFAETGLVVTPFLPGDSLLFALGAFTSISAGVGTSDGTSEGEAGLNLWILLATLTAAGILGDTVNYHIGKYLGVKVFDQGSRFFKKEHLARTEKFYEKWGSFTIVAARFTPIIRTFAPFVAGVGSMHYRRFIFFNVIGAIAWVFLFVLAGHFFGNVPAVKQNFHIVIFGVIGVSLLPMLIPWASSQLLKIKRSQNSS